MLAPAAWKNTREQEDEQRCGDDICSRRFRPEDLDEDGMRMQGDRMRVSGESGQRGALRRERTSAAPQAAHHQAEVNSLTVGSAPALAAPVHSPARTRPNAHTCALPRDGRVKCWGADPCGQRGRGDEPDEMGDNLPAVDLGAGLSAVSMDTTRSESREVFIHPCVFSDR